jgi:hypothetical protein
MADEARGILFRDFKGLILDADPHDREAGVAINQVNAMSTDIGELQSRGGYRPVSFELTSSDQG